MAGGVPIVAPTLASGFLRGKQLIFPLSLVISLFFLWGFSYGLLDVLNKHFQTVLDITKLQSTGLQVVYFGGGYLLFSPIAAEVMKRKGYKITILMGLSLYSLGAVFFWPTAHFSTYEHRIASFGGKWYIRTSKVTNTNWDIQASVHALSSLLAVLLLWRPRQTATLLSSVIQPAPQPVFNSASHGTALLLSSGP
jgi:MFS family permease